MRTASVISALLHIAVMSLAYFGLPWRDELPPLETPIIDVELVEITEETNLPRKQPEPEPEKKPEPKPEPSKPEPAKAAPPPPPPPPPPPEPEPVPEPEPAPPPEPKPEPAPEPKPEPKKAEPKPAPKVVPKPVAKPAVKPKPPVMAAKPAPEKPKPKKKKQPEFDTNRIAALLDKRKKSVVETPKQEKRPAFDLPKLRASTTAPTSTLVPRLTISDVDYLRQQIQRCWTVPAGARDAEGLVVKLRIALHPDGTLRGAPEITDPERMARPGEEFFRAAAESARRAVIQCAPYKMPRDKYDRWRDIVLTFNPRDMLDG